MKEEENEFYYFNNDNNRSILGEDGEYYNNKRDFTTLEAWIKCREVKLFFYKKILPIL